MTSLHPKMHKLRETSFYPPRRKRAGGRGKTHHIMTTSSITQKLTRTVILFAILLSSVNSFSQALVADDPPNNIYGLTFTNLGQDKIVATFDGVFVTSEGTNAGWTVTVGGSGVPLSGSPSRNGSTVTITLSSEILFADRNSVIVSYDAAGGTISTTGGEPDFTNVQFHN